MRVVLDANVIVSAIISPSGSPAEILRLWEQDKFDLLISLPILFEVQRVLSYPKIKNKYHLSEEQIERVITALATAIIVEPDEDLAVIQDDESDNRYLECAIDGEASYVVTGDAHLLALQEYQGVVILPPTGFLALLRGDG
jgi:uncharacterized protein